MQRREGSYRWRETLSFKGSADSHNACDEHQEKGGFSTKESQSEPAASPKQNARKQVAKASPRCQHQVALEVKNPPANAGDMRCRFDPWVRKIPWRQKWQPPPVFLPGKSHGQRSPAGYSPCGHEESDTTEGTWHMTCEWWRMSQSLARR